tara:strand:- start:1571 stop:1816 length:246 start_codon:yes stop_codon:yes gene_type:complete
MSYANHFLRANNRNLYTKDDSSDLKMLMVIIVMVVFVLFMICCVLRYLFVDKPVKAVLVTDLRPDMEIYTLDGRLFIVPED